MKYATKSTITKAEYQQLLGLAVLIKRHYRALRDIQGAVLEITGEPEGVMGHSYDFAYDSDADVDELLKKEQITVVEQQQEAVEPEIKP